MCPRLLKGTRVELGPWTDSWMRGDKYGTVVSVRPYNRYLGDPDIPTRLVRVKMDKSHRTIRVAVANIHYCWDW